MIRGYIPLQDLRSHVYLFKTCSVFAALYDENFWNSSCLSVGLGSLASEDPLDVDWQEVALDCIQHAESCNHSECGVSRLAKNGEMSQYSRLNAGRNLPSLLLTIAKFMREANKKNVKRHELDILGKTDKEHRELAVSTILENIGFQAHCATVEDDAFLYDSGPEYLQKEPRTLLKEHIIACRSFAVFPPLSGLCILLYHGEGFTDAANQSGLTVWDVQAALQPQ